MKILDRYIGKQVMQTVLVVLLAILGIDVFLYLVNELRYVGTGNYHLGKAILFVLLTVPRKIYMLFPWAALLGTLLALGALATNRELVAMRASSVSVTRIGRSVLKAALILMIFVFILGEIVAPKSERLAQASKMSALSGGQTVQTQYGLWVRHGQEFIRVKEFDRQGELLGITRYRFNKEHQLEEVSVAERAVRVDKGWRLEKVKITRFTALGVDTIQQDEVYLSELVDKHIVKAAGIKHLERLSLRNLWRAIRAGQNNELNTEAYELAFWTKVFQPFAVLVMVMLAVPFVFGPLRGATIGFKIITGVALGFLFHMLNGLFAPMTVVYQLPPAIAACLPTAVFFVLGYWLMHRVR